MMKCKYSERFYKMEPFHLAKAEIFLFIGLKSSYRIRFISEIS